MKNTESKRKVAIQIIRASGERITFPIDKVSLVSSCSPDVMRIEFSDGTKPVFTHCPLSEVIQALARAFSLSAEDYNDRPSITLVYLAETGDLSARAAAPLSAREEEIFTREIMTSLFNAGSRSGRRVILLDDLQRIVAIIAKLNQVYPLRDGIAEVRVL